MTTILGISGSQFSSPGRIRSTVPNTAGRPGSYTGTYGQIRLDWAIDRRTSFAIEAVHFAVGDAIRRGGGHDSDYAGVEIKYGW